MKQLSILTAFEQVAAHLKQEIVKGNLRGTLPGVNPLAAELGVNHKTVLAAVRMLEKEGWLESQGRGLQRLIVPPKSARKVPAQKIGVIDYEPAHKAEDWMHLVIQALIANGHTPVLAEKSLTELKMDPARVAQAIGGTDVSAWIVVCASQEIYQWFSVQSIPAYGIFGNHWDVPIAGTSPNKSEAMAQAVRNLVDLGHCRISLICRRNCREPEPVKSMAVYLDELDQAGLRSGDFNLPDWRETTDGFEQCLDSLFKYTPPTALILDEVFLYNAALHYLSSRGLRVPQDVSLISTDPSRIFEICRPSIAHMAWEHHAMRRQVLRWVDQVGRGKDVRKKTITQCKYVHGGTVGPAPKSDR